MDNRGTPVRIFWLSADQHGRTSPPVGPTYFATIKPEERSALDGEWSVRLELLHHLGRDVSSAMMALVSKKAPAAILTPGERFELFEGRWPVASGQVLSARSSTDSKHPAALFFAEALRLRPDNVQLKCLYLRSLVRADDCQRAKEQALAIAGESEDPVDLLLAADVLFDCDQPDSGELNLESLHRVADLAERAFKTWKAECLSHAPSWIAGAGFLSGAISLELMGEHARSDSLHAIAETLLPDSLAPIPCTAERKSGDIVASLLQTKQQMDAQLLLSN